MDVLGVSGGLAELGGNVWRVGVKLLMIITMYFNIINISSELAAGLH